MSGSPKFVRAPNPLGKLLYSAGGKSREEALAGAAKGIESLREWATDFIALRIGEIEKVVADKTTASPELLRTILEEAETLLNLSGTFGLESLHVTCVSLCDLIVAMEEASVLSLEPIVVHIRALRLFSPGSAILPPAEIAIVLDDLSKLIRHVQR